MFKNGIGFCQLLSLIQESTIHAGNTGFALRKNRTLQLTGLVDGQYRLKEVQAPEDYIFTVDYPVTFTVSDGVITGTTGTIEKVAYKPATGTGNAEFIIPNEQGVALPRTGGPGTSHFSAFGGILILVAGVLLLRRKHRI